MHLMIFFRSFNARAHQIHGHVYYIASFWCIRSLAYLSTFDRELYHFVTQRHVFRFFICYLWNLPKIANSHGWAVDFGCTPLLGKITTWCQCGVRSHVEWSKLWAVGSTSQKTSPCAHHFLGVQQNGAFWNTRWRLDDSIITTCTEDGEFSCLCKIFRRKTLVHFYIPINASICMYMP